MLVLTETDRPALIADFQESFRALPGQPAGTFVGEHLAAREQHSSGPSGGGAAAQRSSRCPTSRESLNAPGRSSITEDGEVVNLLTVAGHRGEVLLSQ